MEKNLKKELFKMRSQLFVNVLIEQTLHELIGQWEFLIYNELLNPKVQFLLNKSQEKIFVISLSYFIHIE